MLTAKLITPTWILRIDHKNNFTAFFPVSGDKEFFNVGVCLVLGPNGDAEVMADVDVTIQLDRRIEFVSYHSETGKTMVTQVKGIGNKVEKCVNVSMVTFSNNNPNCN